MYKYPNYQLGPAGSGELLGEVIEAITYKKDWSIKLEADRTRGGEHLAGSMGLTLVIRAAFEDSTNPEATAKTCHLFAVPPAAYTKETWERWVLDCIIEVETHEALEFFKVDGEAPFFPAHGTANGYNPYTIQRRTRGDNLPGAPKY